MGSLMKPLVLVVDDNPGVLNALRRALRPLPLELLFAQSGPQARDLLGRRSPAVLITDSQRPAEDCLAFLKRMRAVHPRACCVLYTADYELQLRGMDDVHVVRKGDEPEVLPRLLARLTGLERTRQSG